MPVYAAKAGGFFFIVFGVVVLIASFVTINPVWNYGPYDPSPISAGTQPDWYIFFVDGALRLMPGWIGSVPMETTLWGHTVSWNILLPGLVMPMLMIGALFTYPFLETWMTGDHREHHILDRPRNAPTRTALGIGALTFYLVISLAATNDIIATHFDLSINDLTHTLRTLFFVGPPIAFWITKRVCFGLQRRDRELALHGRETGRIVRTEDGEYFEVHEPLSEYERWALVQHEEHPPMELTREVASNPVERIRRRLVNFYYEDRIEPVTPNELEAAHHHGEHDEGQRMAESGSQHAAISAGED
jgi:ubiquinol-cytochrome c reductase cytochrome b subunit